MTARTETPLVADIRVDAPAPVRIGDVVVVEVTIRGIGASEARLVRPRDIGQLELVGEPERTERAGPDETAEVVVRLRAQPFATGRLVVPPIAVETTSGSRAETRSLVVDVAPLATVTTEPAAAKLVLPPVADAALVPAALAAVILATAAWRSWRRRSPGAAPPRSGSLGVGGRGAIAEIDALIASARDDAEVDDVYDRLSRFVVDYVARALGMTERSRTSAEIVRAVASRHGAALSNEVAALLEPCDAAKFARDGRDVAAFRRHADAVRAFVAKREGN